MVCSALNALLSSGCSCFAFCGEPGQYPFEILIFTFLLLGVSLALALRDADLGEQVSKYQILSF